MNDIDYIEDSKNYEDVIDLREIFFILAKGKRIVLLVGAFVSIIGIIYSFSLPNIYKSEALLAPFDESSSLINGALSQYSGLAGLAGINLPSGESDSNSKKAIEVMSSLSFFENYIMPEIFLPNIFAVKRWDEKKNTILYDNSIFDKKSNIWKKSIPSAQETFKEFEDHFSLIEDKKTGYVVLSIKHQSPSLAKKWVEVFVDEINNFYRQKDKAHSEKAVEFLNKQISATSLSEIKQATALLLQKEIQKLTLIEANSDYVFEYINPPSVMEEKHEPKRFYMFILFTLLGFILGSIYVLYMHYSSGKKNAAEIINS